jgi:hypothetical protein
MDGDDINAGLTLCWTLYGISGNYQGECHKPPAHHSRAATRTAALRRSTQGLLEHRQVNVANAQHTCRPLYKVYMLTPITKNDKIRMRIF